MENFFNSVNAFYFLLSYYLRYEASIETCKTWWQHCRETNNQMLFKNTFLKSYTINTSIGKKSPVSWSSGKYLSQTIWPQFSVASINDILEKCLLLHQMHKIELSLKVTCWTWLIVPVVSTELLIHVNPLRYQNTRPPTRVTGRWHLKKSLMNTLMHAV